MKGLKIFIGIMTVVAVSGVVYRLYKHKKDKNIEQEDDTEIPCPYFVDKETYSEAPQHDVFSVRYGYKQKGEGYKSKGEENMNKKNELIRPKHVDSANDEPSGVCCCYIDNDACETTKDNYEIINEKDESGLTCGYVNVETNDYRIENLIYQVEEDIFFDSHDQAVQDDTLYELIEAEFEEYDNFVSTAENLASESPNACIVLYDHVNETAYYIYLDYEPDEEEDDYDDKYEEYEEEYSQGVSPMKHQKKKWEDN